jgi:arylsulfatase A-like enzyme
MGARKPRNIVMLVADSLRYDSVARDGAVETPYITSHSTRFTQARSAGCWTLPATASMWMGLLPHEHGATSQTREVDQGRPILGELLQQHGYKTRQLTNNIATTHIFGLDRGFHDVERHWKNVRPSRSNLLYYFFLVAARPRLRQRFLRGDWIMNKMGEDMENTRGWVMSCCKGQLARARAILDEHRKRNEPLFLFVNLMDTHWPYQVGPQFQTTSAGLWGKVGEIRALSHMANQTRYLREKSPISADWLGRLRRRQFAAWDMVAPMVDDFVAELHGRDDEENSVVVCSDHGENFGEDNFEYHFSNVTDAGNRVPFFWLRPGQQEARVVRTPVSMRDVYGSVCQEVGIPREEAGCEPFHLADEPERSWSATEAYWYNNRGRTRPEYRFNQFSFVGGKQRFVHRKGQWLVSELADDTAERPLLPYGNQSPVEDAELSREQRDALRMSFAAYEAFSDRIARGAVNQE